MTHPRTHKPPFARGIEIPFRLNPVAGPDVVYGNGPAAIYYETPEGEPVRVTFEKLDAIQVCRGEYAPYPDGDSDESGYADVYVVENSPWLPVRYAYEAEYYGDCYEWGGDVNEMLTDYDHYLFRFHDEFVEALAAGIWFEKSPEPFERAWLPASHLLNDLLAATVTERFTVAGMTCQVRTNPKPLDTILQDARYCSQPLFHFALELDGDAGVSRRMDMRVRGGATRSFWRRFFGTTEATFDGVATLEQAKVLVEQHIHEVRERRREMGL